MVHKSKFSRRERGRGTISFPCSADHEQDWQPYPVDPYSCHMCDHTYIHTYKSSMYYKGENVFPSSIPKAVASEQLQENTKT